MKKTPPNSSATLLKSFVHSSSGQCPSSYQILLTFCAFALVACGDRRILDGSSPEAFARSVPAVARTLPEAERPDFIASLTVVALANGSSNLDQPSIATLVALDGVPPERVQQLATGVREAQERNRTEQLLAVAEREADALSKRLEFVKEQLEEADEVKSRLSKITISEVSTSLAGQVRTELRFQIRNGNATPVEIRGIALDVRHASGLEKSIGSTPMLGLSEGCLYGQKLGPGSEASVVCTLREKHDPTTEYKLRVAEVHVPGEAPRIGGLESTSTKRQRAESLESELSAKRREVGALRKSMGLEN